MSDGQLRVEPAVLRATCHSLSGAAEHLQSLQEALKSLRTAGGHAHSIYTRAMYGNQGMWA